MELKLNLITFWKTKLEYHPSIKFESEISQTEISFLDITVFKVDNKLWTKVYNKPTDRKRFLHNKSEHSKPLRKILPIARQ